MVPNSLNHMPLVDNASVLARKEVASLLGNNRVELAKIKVFVCLFVCSQNIPDNFCVYI